MVRRGEMGPKYQGRLESVHQCLGRAAGRVRSALQRRAAIAVFQSAAALKGSPVINILFFVVLDSRCDLFVISVPEPVQRNYREGDDR